MLLKTEGIDVFGLGIDGRGAVVHDTMLMSKVLNSTSKTHSLEYCGKVYVGRNTKDKREIIDWLKEHNTKRLVKDRGRALNFSDVPDDILMRRVVWDVETTLLLFVFFRGRVQAICPDLYETERVLAYACVDMETHGVIVDITQAQTLKDRASRDLEIIKALFEEVVPELRIPKKKKKKRKSKGVIVEEWVEEFDEVIPRGEFNPGSNQHLEQAFRAIGIELKYKTQPKKDKKTGRMKGGGNWAFDEYAMLRYVSAPMAGMLRDASEENWSSDKFIKSVKSIAKKHKLDSRDLLPPMVLKYRELSKMISTYYNHLIQDPVARWKAPSGREFGVLHCRFNQAEAMTGRFSSSEPNLQNMPRLLGPRECFVPRRGRRNWHFDYSQIEMRMFVHFAKDTDMAKAIDDDIHLYVATRIYKATKDKITKEQRKRAKATGFGILYGSGPATQAETLTQRGLPTTKMQATKVVASFHREFPSIKRLTNELKTLLVRQGYIENPFGRRYHIPQKFGYKGLNYLCQGTAADIIKAAMVKIWLWLRKNDHLKTKLILTIHDELVLEIPPSEQREVVPAIREMMNDKETYFIPVLSDAEVVTRRWSEKHDPVKDLGLKWAA